MRVRHIKQLLVFPDLPPRLAPLQEMAHNLWYSWNWDIVRLFIRLDAEMWERCNQNPVEMLARLAQHKLEKAANDDGFLSSLDKVYEKYQDYLSRKKWFHFKYGDFEKQTIAYFSLEYGLDTGLPVYSGGLGVLSGDTLKSASDLGLPMVAIGLLYRDGYFRQSLSNDGWQLERYEKNDWYHMPVKLVEGPDGTPIRIGLTLDGMPVQVQIWKVVVGLMPLYLLDTNLQENSARARDITSVLYGGDKDLRIRQEIVLGIGGIKALRALDISPSIYHSNEGHSWFLTLERIRGLMESRKLSFKEASHFVWSTSIFTTHTPVPAGNEKFDPVLINRYLSETVKQLGISWQEFLSIGRVNPEDESEHFGMTVAALKFSAFCNGVSELHGQVSRKMWHNIWPDLPREEIPIKSITNGVHPSSWISHDMNELFESYFGPKFTERPGAPEIWEKAHRIPDIELWRVHNRRRERLVFFARKLLKKQLVRRGASYADLEQADQLLDPHALTIGFARRFSTYKRGDLIFHNLERLNAILNNEELPVQVIISGKAHPLDNPGKEIIKEVIDNSSDPRFRQRVIFLEDYDINIARYLVQGADVWLNNPRRPQEASGTSGMKAALNGGLNLSILDGWWVEGYSEQTGFKIGNGEEYDNLDVQDNLDSESLYNTLEREIIPLFYNRNDSDVPKGWVTKMKAAIHMAGQRFSAQRMLMDYTNHFYIPALRAEQKLTAQEFSMTKEISSWFDRVSHSWNSIEITDIDFPAIGPTARVGQKIPITLHVRLGAIKPEDIRVEIVSGPIDTQEEFLDMAAVGANLNGSDPQQVTNEGIYSYHGEITCKESGRLGITARVIPRNDNMLHTRKPKLISWW
ncbi:MAG: alpha-glucan family phosphorylase [candidate division Zixibacteria bacterium]|nr:alpha-glucan family phosphorylase [candidate division Zixibacteria bacterium]